MLGSKQHKEHGYRTVLGVLRLEKRFSKERLEAVCARGNAIGALSYGSVKSILNKKLEGTSIHPELPSLPVHANVRGREYYQSEVAPCAN